MGYTNFFAFVVVIIIVFGDFFNAVMYVLTVKLNSCQKFGNSIIIIIIIINTGYKTVAPVHTVIQ